MEYIKKERKMKIIKGKKGVEIKKDKYGITLYCTNNGYQWSGIQVDKERLFIIKEIIEQFLKENK